MKNSWFEIKNQAGDVDVYIYDRIGEFGVRAKDFVDALARVPRDTAILVHINSPGGDVADSVAIYNTLLQRPGAVNVSIEGLAASGASVVAMAGATVEMAETAMMMLHDPAGIAIGPAEQMDRMSQVLQKIKEQIITAYERKTGRPRDEIAQVMSDETWFDADEALEFGLIDEITAPLDIAASVARFDLSEYRHVPTCLERAARVAPSPTGWDSADVRREFGNDRASYEAYQRAVNAGVVRVVSGIVKH